MGSTMNLPEPRPAANARSPNRKPRLYKKDVRAWISNAAKETFLDVYLQLGFALACAAIQKTENAVYIMASCDEAFRERWDAVKLLRKSLIEEQVEGLTPKALEVVKETLDKKKTRNKSLRFEAAKEQLKGSGAWRNKQKLELTGKDGKEFVIRVQWEGIKPEAEKCSPQ